MAEGTAVQVGTDTALTVSTVEAPSVNWRKQIGAVLMIAVPVAIWFAPLNLDATPKHAIAIALFMIIAWATDALEHGLTGLIGCYLFWALGVVKVDVAFSGFADDTAWFVVGAMLFGAMAAKTGLARRIAYMVMTRVGTTYSRLLLGLIISDFFITFFVPSGLPRIVLMATIAIGLDRSVWSRQGQQRRTWHVPHPDLHFRRFR